MRQALRPALLTPCIDDFVQVRQFQQRSALVTKRLIVCNQQRRGLGEQPTVLRPMAFEIPIPSLFFHYFAIQNACPVLNFTKVPFLCSAISSTALRAPGQ